MGKKTKINTEADKCRVVEGLLRNEEAKMKMKMTDKETKEDKVGKDEAVIKETMMR